MLPTESSNTVKTMKTGDKITGAITQGEIIINDPLSTSSTV